jgi:hypothetical protein
VGDVHADIRPNGLSQKDLVDLLYMLTYSLDGLCQKLDADGGVADTNYTALCYTALMTIHVENSTGSRTGNTGDYIITPVGISDEALLEWLYDYVNAIETLTEKLDADGTVNDTDYDNQVGNGTAFYFKPGGEVDQKHLVDLLYMFVNAWETLCEQLDADSGVTDTNYEALWFTATVTLKVEDCQGNLVGN